ncbi:2'-5' RNA ligase family protein [Sphingomonas jatrophae]|uniref:2'-5' RNA ligase superfamily protein n=1 Tax=Sphingomonas jatrophae TaxID=1166337 RepID=A0A1I6JL19_9SPHN|nr:2'-5' RNA ligase family protein [Sphingomonas jatrophae]SFR79619.1 2'-5' RNA ligase superfamily protein [Sphingomonas jatrophae]
MTAATATAPIIVTALLGPDDFAWFDGLRQRHFPPERNHLSAHLTMFHHLPPSIGDELDRRLAQAVRAPAPAATLASVMKLGRGTAFRIDSPDLAAIRSDLAHAFADCLTPQDAGGWRAHVTIQNKVEPREAAALYANLMKGFCPRPVRIAGLASWWYRGGPWELRARFAFRG